MDMQNREREMHRDRQPKERMAIDMEWKRPVERSKKRVGEDVKE
jgi:hypothetical protein